MISFFPSFFCPGSLPGHFAGKNRPSDITTPSDKSGKNARELQTHISKQQISLDQFEKHAGKNSPDDKHKHIFIPSTRKSIIQYERITIKKKKQTEKARTCQIFRQRAASEQQFYAFLCAVLWQH